MKKDLRLDDLLADTWLTAVQLRHGVSVVQGEALYQRCLAQVEQVREQLLAAEYSADSIEHITYAQCALLDEIALGRQKPDGASDSAHVSWKALPLQARLFNTLRAGDELYERIHKVLHQPAPDSAVLTCFHRALQLGFQGSYINEPARREQVLAALSEQVAPLAAALPTGLLANADTRRRVGVTQSLWFWGTVALVAVVGLWWGAHHYLHSLLSTQLPGLH